MKKKQKQVRLSMKLLWKLYAEWRIPKNKDNHAGRFLEFVESSIKTP